MARGPHGSHRSRCRAWLFNPQRPRRIRRLRRARQGDRLRQHRFAGQTIRVGWVTDEAFGPVDPEIASAVEDAASQLAALGCHVEQVAAPFLNDADATTALFTFVYGELAPYVKNLAVGREGELTPVGSQMIAMEDPTFAQLHAARAKMEALRSAFAGYFGRFDVLLCPVNPVTATPHGAQTLAVDGTAVPWTHVMSATTPFNLTGLPALSVPYGFSSESLPIGIQLVAKWFDESTILRLGRLLERQGGLGDRRPELSV
ncbi:amidase family protein [Mycobacteroides abscessus]|uniref:amidase family protein n=1 Tax=Mycobacteroides abscessus TaxID=36809 RepID=UPI002E8E44EB|nr:amidase family protein [Mycobacteroides abscessus]